MATELPKSLVQLIDNGHLSKMVNNGPCLLFLRHSDRPIQPLNTCGPDVSLTPLGEARAHRLGEKLCELGIKPGPVLISSPLTRNVQTMVDICASAGWADHLHRIELDKRVMGPGIIYDDAVDVKDVIISYHLSGFRGYEIFNEIVEGREKCFHGVRSLEDASTRIVAFIKEILLRASENDGNSLSLMVSHDMDVAYVLAKFFGVSKFTHETWPPFLDSILFSLVNRDDDDGYTLVAVYGDQIAEIQC